MSLDLAETLRRIENIIRTGTIAQVDYAKALVRVKYDEDENGLDVLTGWRPWLTHRASNDISWHAPEINEQVLLLSPSGDIALAIILPAIYQNAHPNPRTSADKMLLKMQDGAEFEYDRSISHLQITLPAAGTTEVDSPLGLHFIGNSLFTGNIHSTENITADKDITDKIRSMSADRVIYNGHKHNENNVPGGPTNIPNEQQ